MRTNCTKKVCLLSIALLPLFPAKAQFHVGDWGANLLVLYEWPIGFSIGVNYMQGLKDISYNYNGNSSKNHYLGFTIGYWF